MMFVLMPIAAAYEDYGHEVLRQIAAAGRDDVCYDTDYPTAINHRVRRFWSHCIVIVGQTNVTNNTVVVRIPSMDTITEYPLDTFLQRLHEIHPLK